MKYIKDILDYKINILDKIELKAISFIGIAFTISLVYILLKILKNSINKTNKFDTAKKYTIYTLTKYVIIIITCSIVLKILGFDLSVILIGSSALLVGVGLGLQNLFNDYISGIIILLDSTVKVGDVIEANKIICTIQQINLRTTQAITRDDKYIILPNSLLTKSEIVNWTHSKKESRFEISIGVSYNTDINKAMQLMFDAAIEHDQVNKVPVPIVRISNFLDSSVELTLLFWINDIFRAENYKSQIRLAVYNKFKGNKIEIPYPQIVIHKAENK